MPGEWRRPPAVYEGDSGSRLTANASVRASRSASPETVTERKTKLVLGDEHDERLRSVLAECLRALGADLRARQWGLGGSQIIDTTKVKIGRDWIVIEAETYVGLSITGAPRLVARIRALLKERGVTLTED